MRWNTKIPQIGDKRTLTRFAFLPIRINEENRWLEMVTIRQRYHERDFYDKSGWYNVMFIDV